MNDDNSDNDMTCHGRLFQTCAAATGKARPPVVDWLLRGTTSAANDVDYRRLRDLTSDARQNALAR